MEAGYTTTEFWMTAVSALVLAVLGGLVAFGVPLTSEHRLADIGEKQRLEGARDSARDIRPRAVDEHDLAFVLQFAEIRSRFSRER